MNDKLMAILLAMIVLVTFGTILSSDYFHYQLSMAKIQSNCEK